MPATDVDEGGIPIVTVPPPDDAILTTQEVAAWLKVRPRQIERMHIPRFELGRKTKRYLARDVRKWLEQLRRS